MNKITANIDLARRRLLSFALVLFTCFGVAQAADLGQLELGKTYTVLDDWADWKATFVAPSSGEVTITSNPAASGWVPTTGTYGNDVDGYVDYTFSYATRTCKFNAVAGTTYYFISDGWDKFEFTITMDGGKIDLVDSSTPTNSAYSTASGGYIDLTFSESPVADKVTISTNGTTVELANGASEGGKGYQVIGSVLRLHIGTILNEWYANGTIKAEQQFTIDFVGLQSSNGVLYNGDGKLQLVYYAATQPSTIKSATNGDGSINFASEYTVSGFPFLSYFMSNDVNGVLIFTFSKSMDPAKGTVKLMYGNSEGDYNSQYIEKVLTPSWNEDNTVMTLDLRGVQRRPKDLLTSATTYSTITLGLVNMQDKDGQVLYTGGQGSLGSRYYEFTYKEMTSNVAAEVTQEGSRVNFYISDYDNMAYQGVRFYWNENGAINEVIVPKEDLEITIDTVGNVKFADIWVTIPSSVMGKSDVTAELYKVELADGSAATSMSTVIDSTMKILESTPAQGAEIESIAKGYTYRVKLSRTDLTHVQYEITDLNAATEDDVYVATRSTMTAVADEPGVFTATKYGATLNLLKGHTYKMEVLAWTDQAAANGNYNNPAARAYITFAGATEVFTFSDVKYVGATPADGTILDSADQGTFTVEYDGLVKLEDSTTFINLGMGATMKFTSITPIDEVDGYAKKWQLYIAPETMKTLNYILSLTVAAKDQNGKVVEGTEGVEEYSYVKLAYDLDFVVPDLNVTPEAGSTVKTLPYIVVAHEMGLSRNWNSTDKITVYNGKDLVATLGDANITDEEMGTYQGEECALSVRLTMPEEITKAGSYTVIIPRHFFILGNQFSTYNSKAHTFNYTVEGTATPAKFAFVADPADNAEISAVITSVGLTFPNHRAAGPGAGKATITVPGSTTALTLNDATYGKENNQMNQPLGSVVAAEGKYTVTFPEGYFNLTDSLGLESVSPEFSTHFTYTKPAYLPCEFTPAYKSHVEAYDGKTFKMTFSGIKTLARYTSASGQIQVYKPGSAIPAKYPLTSVTVSGLNATLSINTAITVPGEYKVVIPAKLFKITPTSGTAYYTDEITTYFTITGREVEYTSNVANGATVESCDEIALEITNGISGQAWLMQGEGENAPVATITTPSNEVLNLPALTFNGNYGIKQSLNGYASAPGTYTVNFPASYFWYTASVQTLASGGTPSAAFSISFTIPEKQTEDQLTYTVTPDGTEELAELSQFSVTFNKTITGMNYAALAKIGIAKDNAIVRTFDTENDTWEGAYTNTLTFKLATPITEVGSYMISIPTALAFFGEDQDIDSPEVLIKFAISKTQGEITTVNVVSVPAHLSTVSSCNEVYMTFVDFSEVGTGGGKATITKEGEEAINLGDAEFGTGWNEIRQPLGTLAQEDGNYTVNFPAGYLIFDDKDSPAFFISFTVNGQSGVNGIQADNSEARYYNLQGVEVKNPANGIYIKVQGTTISKVTIK